MWTYKRHPRDSL